jgi:hypothetical protein
LNTNNEGVTSGLAAPPIVFCSGTCGDGAVRASTIVGNTKMAATATKVCKTPNIDDLCVIDKSCQARHNDICGSLADDAGTAKCHD